MLRKEFIIRNSKIFRNRNGKLIISSLFNMLTIVFANHYSAFDFFRDSLSVSSNAVEEFRNILKSDRQVKKNKSKENDLIFI